MTRLFIAIDFPEAVNRRLAALCCGVPGARWLPSEQFHLTLRFIGEVDSGTMAHMAEGLSELACPPFSVAFRGVGHFPPRGQPRVLWAGVDAGIDLSRLQGRIENRLRGLGIGPERRKFAPHATLARLKGAPVNRLRDYLIAHDDFATEIILIDRFQLYSSTLGAKAAIHRVEASYPLDGG